MDTRWAVGHQLSSQNHCQQRLLQFMEYPQVAAAQQLPLHFNEPVLHILPDWNALLKGRKFSSDCMNSFLEIEMQSQAEIPHFCS